MAALRIVSASVAALVGLSVACSAGSAAAAPAAKSPRAGRAEGTTASPLRCSAHRGHTLVYYGGPVEDDGYVNVIYWGSWWSSHGKAIRSELAHLLSGLSSSNWAATLRQYCGTSGPPMWTLDLLGAVHIDKANPPAAPTSAQFDAEVNKWIPQPVDADEGTYMIVTPPGTAPAFDAGRCGSHGWTSLKAAGDPYYYLPWMDVPYGIILKTRGCGWNLKQAVAGAVSVVAGHEWAEAMTDPFVNSTKATAGGSGWATTGRKLNVEVADLCEPDFRLHFIHENVFVLKLKTGDFVMQKLWSNAAGKCVDDS